MLLVLDADAMLLVNSAGTRTRESSVEGMRGHKAPIELQYVKGGQATEIEAGQELKYVVKLEGQYDSDPVAAVEGDDTVWIWDEDSQLYRATVSYITAALNALFFVDGNASNDVPELELHIQVGLRDAGDDNWRCNSNPVALTLRNNVLRDDDGTPTALPDAEEWLLQNGLRNPGYWTALTGSGPTHLDSVATAGGALALGHVIITAISGDFAAWQLSAGTNAEDLVEYVRPDDFHATSNQRVWKRIL